MCEECVNVYDKIAHHFNNTRIYKWEWVKTFLNSIEKSSIVYDIGCGNGRNMTDNDLLMYGVDSCKSFVKMCNQKGLNVFESCMTSLPFRSKSADAIICIASFHHLKTEEERLKTIMEMKRVLKKNGMILLSVWSIHQPLKTRRVFYTYGDTIVPWNKYGETFERFYYIFKIEELELLCNKCGITILKHFYDCGNEIFCLQK